MAKARKTQDEANPQFPERFSIAIDTPMRKALEDIASRERRSVNFVIREGLAEYIRNYHKQKGGMPAGFTPV